MPPLPTLTPTLTPTSPATPTTIPTPTPTPAGRLPFVADFEEDSPLAGWSYDPEVWQVVNEGGQNLLRGLARITQPIIILGDEKPEWLEQTATDFVASFSVNMEAAEGARFVFHHVQGQGYHAVEVLPGLLVLKRNNISRPDVTNRNDELILGQARVPVEQNRWHTITIWAEGTRIYVYLDNNLVLSRSDNNVPLGAGQILLQTNNPFRPVRIDNVIIQRAEPPSEHFEGGGSLPSTWLTTSTTAATIERESDGNQYVRMNGAVELTPAVTDIRDLGMTCRVFSEQGGYQLYLRETPGGSLVLDFDAGNMTVNRVDANGAILETFLVRNAYARRWQNLNVLFIEDRLTIHVDGDLIFEETLESTPGAGSIRFVTGRGDILRIDDCLITRSASSRDAAAGFAYALIEEVLARPIRDLRSDLFEYFDDAFGKRGWWSGGLDADGDYTDGLYLRMSYLDRPTFRLMRDVLGVEIFGEGSDRNNYHDSTDIYASVDVRFPEATGTAYMVVRAREGLTGTDLLGYYVELTRNSDGTYHVQVRHHGSIDRTIFYDGPLPVSEGEQVPEWVTLLAVTYQDRLAFFVNDRFIVAIDNAEDLGGTIALGVGENTTADFDTLVIRDTSPHDQ